MKLILQFLKDFRPVFSLELLYRGSRDGYDANTQVHPKIDNQGPTITIIKSTKGKIFGGFTTNNWDVTRFFKNDNKAFIFSLDLG